MKSGLEGRNNRQHPCRGPAGAVVSMKSGLEGRNNMQVVALGENNTNSLNEVRPRRPEQFLLAEVLEVKYLQVSMKSGLEGRNNWVNHRGGFCRAPVSMKSGLEGRNNGT